MGSLSKLLIRKRFFTNLAEDEFVGGGEVGSEPLVDEFDERYGYDDMAWRLAGGTYDAPVCCACFASSSGRSAGSNDTSHAH